MDPYMRCAMTGIPVTGAGDAIWDDGEWISWEWINQQIALQEEEAIPVEDRGVEEILPVGEALCRLIYEAIEAERSTGKTSSLWGRIGELYAAQRFGFQLTKSHSQGHDGRWGNELVEIKTITPFKKKPFVRVKRAGNFSMLAVVRVRPDYRFQVRVVRRDQLPKGDGGAYAVVTWTTICKLALRM